MFHHHIHGALARRLACVLGVLVTTLPGVPTAHAQTPETPAQQCVAGLQLFVDQKKTAEGLPFLEAGFKRRTEGEFEDPNLIGYCALYLGDGRALNFDFVGAQEAYSVARETFTRTGNEKYLFLSLNGLGMVLSYQKQYVDAEGIYQEGLQLARKLAISEFEAAIQHNMISLYDDMGRHEDAITIYQQIPLSERQNIDLSASTLNILGMQYAALGRYTEARNAHEAALKIFEEQKDQVNQASSLKLLGHVLLAQGQYKEARERFDQALQLFGDEPIGRASTLSDLGLLYQAQGQYSAALKSYQEAQAILPPDHKLGLQDLHSTILGNIGTVYLSQGLYAQARPALDEALQIAHSLGSPSRTVAGLVNRGWLFQAQADKVQTDQERSALYEQAMADYQAALQIIEDEKLQSVQAMTLNNIGVLLTKQGHDDQTALLFEQAFQISRELKDSRSQAIALVNLGDIDQDQRRYPAALARFNDARALAEEIGAQPILAEALARAARTLELQGNAAEALAHYEQAMQVLGQMRAVAGDDQARAGFINDYADVYERAARLYLRQDNVAAAFETVERGRARSFLDSLASGTTQFADTESNALAERMREGEAILEGARRELALARTRVASDGALIAQLEQRLAEAERNYTTVQGEILARGGQFTALLPSSNGSVISVAGIQQQLPADTALLAYHVGDKTTLAFVVTRGTIAAEELSVGRADLDQQVRALQSFDGSAMQTTTRLNDLYGHLIAPIKPHLNTSHLLIVPHGVLHYLPFAALSPDGQRFLADDYVLTLLPAASLLPYVRRPLTIGPTIGLALVLANPDGPPAIPGVAAAAQRIGTLLHVEPLLRAAGTKTALRNHSESVQILHLGAHASFNQQSPLQSYIQLTPAENDDGQLKTEEVYRLNLRQTALVTLSACETQVNQLALPNTPLAVTAGDDIVGFQRAFFFAGTRNVVTTLWRVADEPSQLMMERFYTHLRDGTSPAEALRRAQREVREQYSDPRDWAGFVLSGEGNTPLVVVPWWEQLPWWSWLAFTMLGVGLAVVIARGVLRLYGSGKRSSLK